MCVAAGRNGEIKKVCYKQWKFSSEMNSDILVEGMKKLEEVHKFQYKRPLIQ